MITIDQLNNINWPIWTPIILSLIFAMMSYRIGKLQIKATLICKSRIEWIGEIRKQLVAFSNDFNTYCDAFNDEKVSDEIRKNNYNLIRNDIKALMLYFPEKPAEIYQRKRIFAFTKNMNTSVADINNYNKSTDVKNFFNELSNPNNNKNKNVYINIFLKEFEEGLFILEFSRNKEEYNKIENIPNENIKKSIRSEIEFMLTFRLDCFFEAIGIYLKIEWEQIKKIK